MNEKKNELILALLLTVFAVMTRVIFNYFGVFNFNAVMATAFFAGAFLSRNKLALAVPVVAMLLTDAYLGFYDWRLMVVVYGTFGLVMFIGRHYALRPTLLAYITGVLGGSLSFFLLTNFAVWLFGDGTFYPHNIAGLTECFTMAVPFYRNTLLGDLTFTTVLFGAYELLKLRTVSVKRAAA